MCACVCVCACARENGDYVIDEMLCPEEESKQADKQALLILILILVLVHILVRRRGINSCTLHSQKCVRCEMFEKTAATTTSAGPLPITMKVMAMRVYIIMTRQDKTRHALQERELLRVFPCNNTETGARVREKAGQQARTVSKFPDDDNGDNKCIK